MIKFQKLHLRKNSNITPHAKVFKPHIVHKYSIICSSMYMYGVPTNQFVVDEQLVSSMRPEDLI